MKKILRILLAAVLAAALCLTLSACAKKEAVNGRFAAVNPPVESGETVIEHLEFNGDKVTMSSGNTAQTVKYTIDKDKFTIQTDYGNFTYSYAQEEDGTLVIDGVRYRPE